jgi:mannose-6-phosphate isomerase-like protein (cupin superfamily)
MDERGSGMQHVVVPSGHGHFIGRPDGAGGPTIKLSADQSGGAITVYESHRPAGDTGGPAEHFHHACHELFYVLEGDYRFLIDGQVIAAPPGTFIFVPCGVRHTFRSTGAHEGRMLTALLPGGLDRYFEELARQPRGVLDPGVNAAISARHGMTVVGPPGPPLAE